MIHHYLAQFIDPFRHTKPEEPPFTLPPENDEEKQWTATVPNVLEETPPGPKTTSLLTDPRPRRRDLDAKHGITYEDAIYEALETEWISDHAYELGLMGAVRDWEAKGGDWE